MALPDAETCIPPAPPPGVRLLCVPRQELLARLTSARASIARLRRTPTFPPRLGSAARKSHAVARAI
jgi:hypothetical protein